MRLHPGYGSLIMPWSKLGKIAMLEVCSNLLSLDALNNFNEKLKTMLDKID